MTRELATLQPHLRNQPRRTFLLDVQCKFQLDSLNTSDLTASCVSVCSSDASRKWRYEISSSAAPIGICFKLKENATETYEKLKRAYGEHAVPRAQFLRWNMYKYLLYTWSRTTTFFFFWLDAGKPARSQYPGSPVTGHLVSGFS